MMGVEYLMQWLSQKAYGSCKYHAKYCLIAGEGHIALCDLSEEKDKKKLSFKDNIAILDV